MYGRDGWHDRLAGCRQQRGGDYQVRDRRAAPQKKERFRRLPKSVRTQPLLVSGMISNRISLFHAYVGWGVEYVPQEYLKYHIVAVLGLHIILESEITPSNINDVTMLPPMLNEMRRQHLLPDPSVFHADRGYDSNYNCQVLFEMGIIPNIKQRSISVNRGKPYRSRAAKIFDKKYHQRGMTEGIFGGEESKRHQLYCRYDPARQPPPVRQDPGHHLEYQGTEPTQT